MRSFLRKDTLLSLAVVMVIVICLLSIIPWPGPSVFKISCSRESSRVVRKIVHSRWLPILEKYQVKLPLECPFHPLRDIFGPQQSAKKQHRPSQWTCGFCGKSFFEEKHLDMHFENRHRTNINTAEDAVCLADYCDMMRCEVLIAKDATLAFGSDPNAVSTDIEVWSEATAYRTALSTSGPRDVAKIPESRKSLLPKMLQTIRDDVFRNRQPPQGVTSVLQTKGADNCDKNDATKSKSSRKGSKSGQGDKEAKDNPVEDDDDEDDEEEDDEDDEDEEEESENDSNATSQCEQNLVDSSLPPVDRKQQRLSEMQRMKANCNAEEIGQLKTRCEVLVRDCIVGLLVQLSLEDFRSMEEEMNRAICWYLTCERYWEDGPLEQRPFPWGLVFVLVMVLSMGVCLCYYIIWILFDEDFSPSTTNQQLLGGHHPTAGSGGGGGHLLHHGRHYLQPGTGGSSGGGGGSGIYRLQDGGHHSAASLNNLVAGTSGSNDIQHTPQIHASPGGQGGGVGSASAMLYTTADDGGGGYGYAAGSAGGSAAARMIAASGGGGDVSATSTSAAALAASGAGGGSSAGAATGGGDFGELGQSEHYIYVTYPPELKRRLLERYGRDIYMQLLRKDVYDYY
ncbi:keratin, type I cytoskeletal 9 isoform X3 [Anopheles gambiae]|uniref:keratin, type I cytoskeletal 9 isoform X3 n=1 Tax=Anopheles gambiae TaxID=7165 RepID=UPI002AC9D7BB|nr:keratin, type I cytoskeletal 9 isoform X3 [Anopheles gambiae]